MSSVEDAGRGELDADGVEPRESGSGVGAETIRAVVDSDGNERTCTLYPDDVDGVPLMSQWITAREGSFVAIAEMQ